MSRRTGKKKKEKKKKNTATVYGAAIEAQRERGGGIRLKMCESLEFGELRGQTSGKGRVDKSVSEL